MLWLTDTRVFPMPAGKIYLSLLTDCFDGMPVAQAFGTSPNAELANAMLEKAIAILREGEHPILHSDQGCRCRWPDWIKIEEEGGIIRSMSKKGCPLTTPPDEGSLWQDEA